MIINDKKVLLFPEYYLTDFPPQVMMSKEAAYKMLKMYESYGFDICVAGYVEKDGNNLYSSCFVLDDDNTYNIRKQYPYDKENEIITAWDGGNPALELSIGRTCFFLCNDLNMEIKNSKMLGGFQGIENLFLISAMFYNFDKTIKAGINYCKKFRIKRFITVDRFNGIDLNEIKYST